MRFVALKTEEQQARSKIFRTATCWYGKEPSWSAHCAVPSGGAWDCRRSRAHRVKARALRCETRAPSFRSCANLSHRYLDHIARLDVEIAELDKRLRRSSQDDRTAKRLQSMPGTGPITVAAIEAFAPPTATFRRGRNFAAWLGLVPRQHTTGGKPKLERTSTIGQRDIRRLLIIGAVTVVRWGVRKGAAKGSWLARMLAEKQRLVMAIALANKIASSVWAMLIKGEDYRGSALSRFRLANQRKGFLLFDACADSQGVWHGGKVSGYGER
jgi:transposase